MAATTEKSCGDALLGRNIFRSNHRYLSLMSQLKNPHLIACSSALEPPSPTDSPKEDDIAAGARVLARDFICYKVDGSSSDPKNETARTLRRVGDELMGRHTTVVNAVATRLKLSDPAVNKQHTLSQRMFSIIADEIAKDKQENWGRVVSLFVLGGILALNNMEKEGGQDIENIINFVGDYVGTHKRPWIEKNGGWDGFVKFFNNDAAAGEKKVLKGLLCAGLSLGAIMAATRQ